MESPFSIAAGCLSEQDFIRTMASPPGQPDPAEETGLKVQPETSLARLPDGGSPTLAGGQQEELEREISELETEAEKMAAELEELVGSVPF
jgi:hypothetical protein